MTLPEAHPPSTRLASVPEETKSSQRAPHGHHGSSNHSMEHVSEGANELALDLGALTNTGSHDYTQTYPLPISAAAAESTKTENDSDRLSMPMPTRSAYLSPQLLQAVAYNTELQPLPQAEKVNPMNTWIESPHQLHHAYSNDSLSAHGSSSCGSGSGSPDLYTSALPPLNQLQGPLLPQAHLERRRWRTLSGASTQSSTSTSSPRFSLTPASSREEMRAAGPDSKEDVGFSRTGQDTPHAEMAFADSGEELDVLTLVIGTWQRNACNPSGGRELQVTIDKTAGLFHYTTWELGWAFRIIVPFHTIAKISTPGANVLSFTLSHLPLFQVSTQAIDEPSPGLFGFPSENDFTANMQASTVPTHDLYLGRGLNGVIQTIFEASATWPSIYNALQKPGALVHSQASNRGD